MAYISLEARHQTASPRRRIRWERIAIIGASLGLWAVIIALATTLS